MSTPYSQQAAGKGNGDEVDVLLIGAGIMSATLGAMIRQLEPDWTQLIYERLDGAALESSYPWNNAGTGHSALCELNYTCLLYTSPSPRDGLLSRMPSSA